MLGTILQAMQDAGWSADNIAFGSGGGLLQKLNRDEIKIILEHRSLDYLVTELDRSGNRIVVGMVMSSLIFSRSFGSV